MAFRVSAKNLVRFVVAKLRHSGESRNPGISIQRSARSREMPDWTPTPAPDADPGFAGATTRAHVILLNSIVPEGQTGLRVSDKAFGNCYKGFTIVEFMVAITLLALMVVAAGSLIVYQSSTGRESTQRRTAGESLGLAMMMIRQDVMHAGYGLPDNAQTEDRIMRLAVWLEDAVNDSKGSWYRELYVNNGRYVLIDSLSTSPAIISSGLLTGTQWTTINSKLTPYDVGCLLLVNESTGLDPVDSDTGRQTRRLKFSGTPTFTAPSTYTYDLSPAAAAVFTYAPGICYKLEPFDASAGYEATTNPYTKLVRNGRTPDGKSQVILGGDPNFRVVDFRVRAMFYGKKKPALGPPDNEIWRRWSPGPPPPPYVMKLDDNSNSHDFNMLYPEDLRFLEILIGYQNSKPCGASDTKDPAGVCWGPTFYRTMQVSPRNMVLNAYDRTS